MKVRELVLLLKKDGLIEKNKNGSHLQLTHPIKKGKVTVPMHGGYSEGYIELNIKTVRS